MLWGTKTRTRLFDKLLRRNETGLLTQPLISTWYGGSHFLVGRRMPDHGLDYAST